MPGDLNGWTTPSGGGGVCEVCTAGDRKLVKVGVSFDAKERNIGEVLVG